MIPNYKILREPDVQRNASASNAHLKTIKYLIKKDNALGGFVKPNFIMNEDLNFGQAIEALKQGKRVARKGWNGKGMFVFQQVPSEISEDIVPKMQSLPQSVKDEFAKRGGSIRYKNQLAMVYPDNTIFGWVASPSDVLEEDWCILD
jgi:hypothetical protein